MLSFNIFLISPFLIMADLNLYFMDLKNCDMRMSVDPFNWNNGREGKGSFSLKYNIKLL